MREIRIPSPRSYCWPEGHWDWYQHLAFKHGVRRGNLIFIGGQVDKTSGGAPRNAGDLAAQTEVVVNHIQRVLAGFGAGVQDLVKLVAFYATDGDVDEAAFVADVGRHLQRLGADGRTPGPVIVPTPLPWLALPGMRVEIEAVAMCEEDGKRPFREAVSSAGCAAPPAPFVDGLRCQQHVFLGAHDGGNGEAGAREACALMDATLAGLGVSRRDLVRVGAWSASTRAEHVRQVLAELDATSVLLPTPRLGPHGGVRMDGWAMTSWPGNPLGPRSATDTRDWRWPDGRSQVCTVACAELVFVSAQAPLDADGKALHGDNLNAQTRLCMERTQAALAAHGLGLDHMLKQTSFYLGNANPEDIVTNQRLRSSFYKEPAGASTGVPLQAFCVPGAMVSVDTIAAA